MGTPLPVHELARRPRSQGASRTFSYRCTHPLWQSIGDCGNLGIIPEREQRAINRMATNTERVLEFLRSIAPKTATNSEIVARTGVRPHQQVFQITKKLQSKGLIQSRLDGKEWMFWIEAGRLSSPPPGDTRKAAQATHSQNSTSVTSTANQLNAIALSASDLSELRRGLLRLLDSLENQRQWERENLASRIQRLVRSAVIPYTVASCMHTIRAMRNDKEYEAKTVSEAEAQAVSGALSVIKEWAQERGLALPKELQQYSDQHEAALVRTDV
jgi:hypothetical protein